jgi:hypothetical protein
MLAQDFVTRLALEGLRALIPGDDPALGIKNKNGIVFHALDQEAKEVNVLTGLGNLPASLVPAHLINAKRR